MPDNRPEDILNRLAGEPPGDDTVRDAAGDMLTAAERDRRQRADRLAGLPELLDKGIEAHEAEQDTGRLRSALENLKGA